jgi:hypothetical protein
MQSSRKLTQALLALSALVVMGTAALAADPGLSYPWTSEVSDQKAGSILFYNFYTSSTSQPNRQNTRFNITNTSSTSAAFVHLFFVEGSSCNVSDRTVCLTANQTMTFLASEQDPGTTGYLIAIAVDGVVGCPTSFNFLIGDEYIKLELGHQANLGAEAFAALYVGDLPGCDGNTVATNVNLDGVQYNRVPRVLAVSSIGSTLDGNVTRIIINRVGGSLLTSANTIGQIFGELFDDAEGVHSFTIPSSGCQRVATLGNDFPRTAPRFDLIIPAGSTGWMKFWTTANQGILGAVLNFNANAATAAGAFNGGHNLHKLTLTEDFYTIPVFPPTC